MNVSTIRINEILLSEQVGQLASAIATFSPLSQSLFEEVDGKQPILKLMEQREKIQKTISQMKFFDPLCAPSTEEEFNEKCRTWYQPYFANCCSVLKEINNWTTSIKSENATLISKIWMENLALAESLKTVDYQTFNERGRPKVPRDPELREIAEQLKKTMDANFQAFNEVWSPASDQPDEEPPAKKEVSQHLSVTEYMAQNGLVGLPEDLDITLGPIVARQSSLASEIAKRDLPKEKGILLYGPPGTGKTSFAKRLAEFLGCEEKNVQLVSGTELMCAHVGETEAAIRKLFAPSKKAYRTLQQDSPLFIVIIDEIDSIAPNRDGAVRNWEKTQVNQLLTSMDGFFSQDNVLIMGLTNRYEDLDPALLRTGRFGTQIKLELPTAKGREDILKIYLKTLTHNNFIEESLSLPELALLTDNYSGADLKGLVEQVNRVSFARYSKARQNKEDCHSAGTITLQDFKNVIEQKKKGKKSD